MLKLRIVILLVVAAVALDVAAAQDYCAACKDNTLCKYKEDRPSSSCGSNVKARGVATSEQKIIVDKHNELRARVAGGQERLGSNGAQPGATNMKKMIWDAEIAKLAQRWIDQCAYGHDQCRNIPKTSVGQNIAMTMSSYLVNNGQANWTDATIMWYNEVKDWNKNNIEPFKFDKPTGHYTQVAWADTYMIGFGYIYYQDVNDKKYPYKAYYECDYGPAGNMRDAAMYKTGGKPCTQCPGAKYCENNLCAY